MNNNKEDIIKELHYKNQIIEQQKSTIENLQKQLSDLNEINKNSQKMNQSLQDNINLKQQELITLKNKIKYKEEEINQIKLNNNINNSSNSSNNEISFAICFTDNKDIHYYPMICKPSDPLVKLEEQLYNEFPKYKDIHTYLSANGNVIKRFRTIEENGIQKGNVILINEYDQN